MTKSTFNATNNISTVSQAMSLPIIYSQNQKVGNGSCKSYLPIDDEPRKKRSRWDAVA